MVTLVQPTSLKLLEPVYYCQFPQCFLKLKLNASSLMYRAICIDFLDADITTKLNELAQHFGG